MSPRGTRRQSNVILHSGQWSLFQLSYVENVSEAVARIMRKHMKPYKTLNSVLVHPKDKQEKEYLTECVYIQYTYIQFIE